ncbi:type VII secretion protein EccB [Lentzea sp. NPDC004789]
MHLTFGSPQGPAVRIVLADTNRLPEGTGDVVSVAPGNGLLAAGLAAPGVPTGTLFLITDLGAKSPLPSSPVADQLGYAGVQPTPVLDLLPSGNALDPATAATPHPPGKADASPTSTAKLQ